jgi:hypothetical protein
LTKMRYDDEFGYGDLREEALERESKQNWHLMEK